MSLSINNGAKPTRGAGRGHILRDLQNDRAAPEVSTDHSADGTQIPRVSRKRGRSNRKEAPSTTEFEGGRDQTFHDLQVRIVAPILDPPCDIAQPYLPVDARLLAGISDFYREHRSLQMAVGDMDRRIKASERWAAVRRLRAEGKSLPYGKFPEVTPEDMVGVRARYERFYTARAVLEALRKECETHLSNLVKRLPTYEWALKIKGVDERSLAAVIGNCGDLNAYRSPANVWRRMCVAVIDGKAQRRVRDKVEAAKQRYSPERRSLMFVIGDNFVRAGREGNAYAALYYERKDFEIRKAVAAGLTVAPAAQIARKKDKTGYISDGEIHKRAHRYVEKRFLKNLWIAWRQETGFVAENVRRNALPDEARAIAERQASDRLAAMNRAAVPWLSENVDNALIEAGIKTARAPVDGEELSLVDLIRYRVAVGEAKPKRGRSKKAA